MSLSVDASALLKLYVEDPDGDACEALLVSDPDWSAARHGLVEARRNLRLRTSAGRILEAVPDERRPVTRTVPVRSDDAALSELLEQTAEGDLVQLTAVVLSRQAYDELLLAVSADARRELADIMEQARREVAQAGLDRSVVDEAIAAVRAR